ncbi:MAG: zinc-binding dehydrogenase [Candidatus Synoicihabitans palmerolidicus]|nr:zinc-binding dehydrogenase [Candidatus Synoicihabitans palmerolidicus]
MFGAALLRDRGVPHVILTEPDEARRATAARLGADVISTADFAQHPSLADGGCDAVIEVAGDPRVVVPGANALRPGGPYLWVGMVHPDTSLASLTGEQVVRRCMRVTGVYNYAPHHLDEAINLLARCGDSFPWDDVISPALPLAQLNKAFALALERRWARVSVDCTQPLSLS